MNQRSVINTGDISLELNEYILRRKRTAKEVTVFNCLRKREVERSETGEFIVGDAGMT